MKLSYALTNIIIISFNLKTKPFLPLKRIANQNAQKKRYLLVW